MDAVSITETVLKIASASIDNVEVKVKTKHTAARKRCIKVKAHFTTDAFLKPPTFRLIILLKSNTCSD